YDLRQASDRDADADADTDATDTAPSPPNVRAVVTREVARRIFGGSGTGTDGNGGTVDISTAAGSTVSTFGAASHAILAQSLGGGGGDIGHVEALSLAAGETAPATETAGTASSTYDFTVALGSADHSRTSSSGDSRATLAAGASATTSGTGSRAVLAQSIAGGGGTFATVLGSTHMAGDVPTATFDVTLGGEQGHSGHPARSGTATVTFGHAGGANAASVITAADLSHALVAQSVASGGGSAGVIISDTLSIADQRITARLGGRGAAEGAGGLASVAATGNIATAGVNSFGILSQSIGSGGGEFFAGLAHGASATLQLDFGTEHAGYASAGEAKATLSGTVATHGNLSQGIVVQSVGGGGGVATVNADAVGTLNLNATFGRTTATGGNGGRATVDLAGGHVVTGGDFAFGVLAQSIGGGGGLLSVDAGSGTAIFDLRLHTGSGGTGGAVDVSLDGASSITTSGAHAHGIFAQSAGSGGGLALIDGETIGIPSGPTTPASASAGGGAVTVTSHGDIRTSGAYSDGIFAYSASGGALVVESDNGGRMIAGHETGRQSGQVRVNQRGTVSVSGNHASAISALARRSDGTAISLDIGGRVSAAGEEGAAIRAVNGTTGSFAHGGNSTITTSVNVREGAVVLARDAATATNAIMIDDALGRFSLGIDGTVAAVGADGGRIASYGGRQTAIRTNGDGRIDIGASGGIEGTIEVDRGTVSVTNNGVIDGSLINAGLYTLGSSGRHFLEIDPGAGTSAYISALTVENDGGTLNPYLASFGHLAHSVEIVDSVGAGSVAGHVANTPVLTFHTTSSADSVSVTGVTASFANAGLSGNAETVARAVDPLVQRWMNGESVSPEDENLYAFLLAAANTTGSGALSGTLSNHLDASQDYDVAVNQHVAAISHIDNLHSCGTQYGPWAALREGECNWAKATHRITDNFASGNTVRASGFSVGRQVAIAENWRLGAGAGFNMSTSSGAGVSSDGYGIHAGGVLKYTRDAWLASAAVTGSYTWGEASRVVPLPGAIAQSDQKAAGISARLRMAHAFDFSGVFAIPTLDLDMSWIHDFGYTERGAGSFGLAVDAHDMFLADLHPQLRLGTDIRFDGDLVVRPYLEAGLAIALDGEHRMNQSFTMGALAGTKFSVATDRERVRGTVTAGLSVLQGERFEAKLRYNGSFGRESRSHAASFKFGLHF
ncbi:autotransporter outer membrane beta-barrel domain-containing protein, partial [Stappia sp.]|uniref:autotransporter outer membrane beta-barrel domain-containing protein n=1 Tax=Stappia sp. TaxID=1870903 RepID=UPI003A993C47